jgi:hypothetical protein
LLKKPLAKEKLQKKRIDKVSHRQGDKEKDSHQKQQQLFMFYYQFV